MALRNVLVLTIAPLEGAAAGRLRDELAKEGAAVKVVSPASKLSRLAWLTNDEADAREEAEQAAGAVADAVVPEAEAVEAEVGDVDPLQAAEDALRTFEADRLVVVLPAVDHASWLDRSSVEDGFERFGIPVDYVLPDGSTVGR